jgi:hypothetical protein
MKLSFLPGQLFLDSAEDGQYRLVMRGEEVIRTRSQKIAVSRFNKLRQEMEQLFPRLPLTEEEKNQILRRHIEDSLLGHNSIGGRKKKTTAASTRTFGG